MPLQFKFLLLGLLLNLAHAERVAPNPSARMLRVPLLKIAPAPVETESSNTNLVLPTQAGILKLDTQGFNIGGKVVEQALITQTVPLERNQESKAFTIGAVLKAGQKALFEMEVQDRSGWNNSNRYYCQVLDSGTQTLVDKVSLEVIDTSQFQNKKTNSGSPRLSSGTRAWSYTASSQSGMLLIYQISCGGHQYGAANGSLFVRVKKTIFD